jgi:hypothetical protein
LNVGGGITVADVRPQTTSGWRERWARRENQRRTSEYEQALSAWQRDDGDLRQMLAAAEGFHGLPPGQVPTWIGLRRGEVVYWVASTAHMVEVRSQVPLPRPGYQDFSLGQLRGPFTPGPGLATVADQGAVAVTNQRVIFQGGRHNREWAFANLVGLAHDSTTPRTLMQITNRKKVSGVLLDPSTVAGFRFNLTLAYADGAGGRAGFVAHLRHVVGDHQRLVPPQPVLVTADQAPHPLRRGLGLLTTLYLGPPGASAARRITQAVTAVLATLILISLVVPGTADTSTPTDDSPAAATSQETTPESSAPTIEKQTVTETREIPFKEKIVKDSSHAKGTREVRTEGVPGVKTLTYEVTLTNGVETDRQLLRSEITKKPVTQVIVVGTKEEPPEEPSCDPNYSGACVPIASDVDCAGGSGNGPEYVEGPVRVTGADIYGLDDDGDGIGCET